MQNAVLLQSSDEAVLEKNGRHVDPPGPGI